LNLLGADTRMPHFSDTFLGTDSSFRRALFEHGIVLRMNVNPQYTQNTLQAPVPAAEQVYVGDRFFEKAQANPILTYDMRHFHLRGAQLNMGAVFEWVNWNKAGPRSAGMTTFYLYKAFGEGRFELKAGYIINQFEFLGLNVGGSVAGSSQGVYAVLPFEVGLSQGPEPAPGLNLKLKAPAHLYIKTGLQRGLDAAGGQATVARNATGFRFDPKGDKLLTIAEGGFNRDTAADSHQTWIRTGYLHNTTPYSNSRTGGVSSGNYCAFFLADHQFFRSSVEHPDQGFYAGVSAMAVPADMNVYSQYYEARLYREAPFRSRPFDMFSVVATRSVYSRDTIRNLEAQGQTVWHNSSSITGSYSIHPARGAYVAMGASYVTGPAVTPHVPNALTATIQGSFFF
jgi:porin